MSDLASSGLYPNYRYAMDLAQSIAAEEGRRTRVQAFNGRSNLWEIRWAAAPVVEGDTNG